MLLLLLLPLLLFCCLVLVLVLLPRFRCRCRCCSCCCCCCCCCFAAVVVVVVVVAAVVVVVVVEGGRNTRSSNQCRCHDKSRHGVVRPGSANKASDPREFPVFSSGLLSCSFHLIEVYEMGVGNFVVFTSASYFARFARVAESPPLVIPQKTHLHLKVP